jgi:hypothetical protein
MNSANNPYSTTTLNTPPTLDMSVQNQYMQHKQDEQGHMADKKQPFTAESLQEYISELYFTLTDIRKAIKHTENEDSAKNKQGDIEEIYKIIDTIGSLSLIDLPKAIDKLYL